MGTHQLIVGLREYQVAHLGTSVNAIQSGQIYRVPETNALISSSTSGRKQASMERTPIYSFDSSLMI